MNGTLEFPNTDMSFAFAVDGFWHPEVLKINEQLLADEMTTEIEEDARGSDYTEFDSEYHVQKEPFDFLCGVRYKVYQSYGVYHGKYIKIQDINICCYWSGADLPMKYCEETLISMIELQVNL